MSAQTAGLPQGLSVKDNGPRTYRFTIDYNSANTKGETLYRQRIAGEYTRGLVGGEVRWKNVTQAQAVGPTAPFGAAQKSDLLEGFRYRNDLASTMKPDFFKGFPPTAVFERNLVWDTGLIELKPVEPEALERALDKVERLCGAGRSAQPDLQPLLKQVTDSLRAAKSE
jgi:hypothetical protein